MTADDKVLRVVVTNNFAGFRIVSGVLAADSLFISGSAFANAANTDISAPLRAAQGAEKSVSGEDGLVTQPASLVHRET